MGWGGDNTKRAKRYATWSSLALDATLHDLHLHLKLRYMIFTCTWCYPTWFSFTFWQMRMGRGGDNTKRVSRYAIWSSLAFDATLHDLQWPSLVLDATLHDLHLHLMLRYMILVDILTEEDGVGLGWGGVGIIPNVSRATLHDLHSHLTLRYMIFTCTWCYATCSSLALDTTLHVLHLHLMLRYMIFTCTWSYATWSSLALDATLHDLHTWYHATWSSLALDATLHDLRLHLPWTKAQPQTLKSDWAEKRFIARVTWSKTK